MKQLDLEKIKVRLSRIPREFNGKVAQVGFPAGLAYEDGTSVAYVAAIQEMGAPEVSIPARPYFKPAVQHHSKEWSDVMAGLVANVGAGGASADDVLDIVGRAAVADVQAEIAAVTSPPLSLITVMLRKWRKDGKKISGKTVGEAAAAVDAGEDSGGDDKPLNDSGLLIASVRNAVNKQGGEFKV
jgi:hypothetical protein